MEGEIKMAINKVSIENFTVFNKTEIDFCDGMNVFIGENGTGKTHLLKIIYAICESLVYLGGPNSDAATPLSFNTRIYECFQANDYTKLYSNLANNTESRKPIIVRAIIGGDEHFYQIRSTNGDAADTIFEPKLKGSVPAIFIPAKDMLTHARLEKDFMHRNLPFDKTEIDILNKAGISTMKTLPPELTIIMDKIAGIIGGRIVYKNDRYYTEKEDGTLIDFAFEAEGFKKLGLLYRLIETGYFEKGSVLIWDEPEANLNPKWIPFVVDVLFELSRRGMQVFVATHEYNMMKYFSVKKYNDSEVAFFSLYKNGNSVAYEREEDYSFLEYNTIVDANTRLLEDEIERVL